LVILAVPVAVVAQGPELERCDFSRYRPLRVGNLPPDCAVKRVDPVYPQMGHDMNVAGTVVVKVVINRAGEVIAACVVSGHPLLGDAALTAARQWKFKQNFCFKSKPAARYLEAELQFRFVAPRSGAAPPN
jgi:TonB family protein